MVRCLISTPQFRCLNWLCSLLALLVCRLWNWSGRKHFLIWQLPKKCGDPHESLVLRGGKRGEPASEKEISHSSDNVRERSTSQDGTEAQTWTVPQWAGPCLDEVAYMCTSSGLYLTFDLILGHQTRTWGLKRILLDMFVPYPNVAILSKSPFLCSPLLAWLFYWLIEDRWLNLTYGTGCEPSVW